MIPSKPRNPASDSLDVLAPLRVLLVEDDDDTRANFVDILELDQHQVVEAGTLAAALATLKTDAVDAIIMDRQLPDGDAREIIGEITTLVPGTPIVIVTGMPDIESAISALREGAYDYILKPVSPEGLRASLRRIAERRNVIEELRKQRDFAESLIETAQSIVLVLSPDAKIVRFNSFMSELSGYSLEEVVGLDWFDTFIPDADHDLVHAVFQRAIRGERIHANTNAIVTKMGESHEISWWATALRDENQNVTGVLSVGHDLTELRRAEAKIVQSERLAAIGQMVAGLAHESRNAFQRSQACLEMLELEVSDRSDALDLIAKIQKALDHIHHLYEEVRDYAAPINLNLQEENLRDIWRETWIDLEMVRRDRNVNLYERCSQNVNFDIDVDRHALLQVFRNILENAISSVPDQGEITITCSDKSLDGRPAVEIGIADNGKGIPRQMRRKIFEPFFTTRTKGTGLGLAIVQRLINAHGGSISVGESDSGGALFSMRIPRGR